MGGYIIEYQNITLRLLPERKRDKDIVDYKFFCFDGKVRFLKVDFNRFSAHRANYYTPDFVMLPWGESIYPPDINLIAREPDNLRELVNLAERLSSGHKFLRVDLYDINNHPYFGELTFYPNSGMVNFTDEGCDMELGEMIMLPIEL